MALATVQATVDAMVVELVHVHTAFQPSALALRFHHRPSISMASPILYHWHSEADPNCQLYA
jgi:hypothetical protein